MLLRYSSTRFTPALRQSIRYASTQHKIISPDGGQITSDDAITETADALASSSSTLAPLYEQGWISSFDLFSKMFCMVHDMTGIPLTLQVAALGIATPLFMELYKNPIRKSLEFEHNIVAKQDAWADMHAIKAKFDACEIRKISPQERQRAQTLTKDFEGLSDLMMSYKMQSFLMPSLVFIMSARIGSVFSSAAPVDFSSIDGSLLDISQNVGLLPFIPCAAAMYWHSSRVSTISAFDKDSKSLLNALGAVMPCLLTSWYFGTSEVRYFHLNLIILGNGNINVFVHGILRCN